MNREMLKQNGVRLRGVILNKVNPKKMDMIKVQTVMLSARMLHRYTLTTTFLYMLVLQDYYSRALKRWDIPLVGCIPDLKDLSCPTMADYAKLLKSKLISGVCGRYLCSSSAWADRVLFCFPCYDRQECKSALF